MQVKARWVLMLAIAGAISMGQECAPVINIPEIPPVIPIPEPPGPTPTPTPEPCLYNSAPVAYAGPDQEGDVGSRVTLSALGSYDGDGDALSYRWVEVRGEAVVLDGAETAEPSFLPALEGIYEFTVTASDSCGASDDDTVRVNVGPGIQATQCPVARAAADQNLVPENQLVHLYGTLSYDPQGLPLTYSWRQLSQAGVPAVMLSQPNAASCTFVAPAVIADVTLTFELTVNNGWCADSTTVEVTIQGAGQQTGPQVNVILVGSTGTFGPSMSYLAVQVSVQDANGQLIQSGLSLSNFEFQSISVQPEGSGTPVAGTAMATNFTVYPPTQGEDITAILDFDSSGSMTWNDPGAAGREAGAEAFFDVLDAGDQVAIMDFGGANDPGFIASRLLQDFTSDLALLRDAVTRIDDGGNTPLWDSGIDALGLLAGAGTGGTLVLLTDGLNNQSTNMSDDVITAANSQDVTVFTVGLGDNLDFAELRDVAASTNGAFAEASDATALEAAFTGIGAAATAGFIEVEGTATYPTQPSGRYTLSGELVTTVTGSAPVVTPFSMTADF